MKENTPKEELIKNLSAIMPRHEAEAELDFLLKEEFNLSKKALILNPEKINNIFPHTKNIIEERIKTRKPLQYIINKAVFYGDIYYVNENVLIPRPETELLVNKVINLANSKTKILDIGTGSGCIAITLAKHLQSDNITTCDISQSAIDTAKINAEKICPDVKINFILSDLFKNINEKYNIIVSNPPYIDLALKADLEPEVINFEPKSALFAQDKGLYFYKEIITNAGKYLYENGIIVFEIGIDQAEDVSEILKSNNFTDIEIIPDYNKIPRVIIAKLNRT